MYGEGKSLKTKKKRQIKAFSIAASFLMTFSLIAPVVSSAESNGKLHQSVNETQTAKVKVSDRLLDEFKDDEKVTFLIKFGEKADVKKAAADALSSASKAKLSAQKSTLMQRSAVISELKATALTSQQNVKQFLEKEVDNGNAESITAYHIVNGMAVTATKKVAEKVATFNEVEKILPNETRQLLNPVEEVKTSEAPAADDEIEWNVDRVGAPAAWDTGIDGSGTVIASIDTGVEWDHPALKEKYRGYDAATGEVDHQFSWFDATAGEDEPYDDLDHGTHTIGTMVGGEEDDSNQVGVAPGAKFISAKAFSAAGGTDADLLAAGQWILAPTDADGNEHVEMAPDVVNNSWGGGPGLDEWYRDMVIAWRTAGIFPEFSAGNTDLFNPGGPGSVASPSNYPESFATGATDSNDMIADFSLRGPSPYDEIKPDISAPGVSIRSSLPGGSYGGMSGTSMAGPVVTAVAAMLRQADANISVDDMEQILLDTTTARTDDEYPESPNNGYGYGLVNAYDAISSMQDGLGTLEGQVTKVGEDDEAPTFEHEGIAEAYAGMDLDLTIQVSDNISIAKVALNYENQDGETQTVEASRISGDFKDGEYAVTIPGEDIGGDSLTYSWLINDFGNNEVTSDDYVVEVLQGISVGYSEDFESTPTGWTSFGENDSWEWGEPTSGPGSAASGDKVYATNLDGEYEANTNATLVMPPVDLPEGDAFLQFNQWHELEKYDSGGAYDFGHIMISTDQEEWEQLARFEGLTDDWENVEIDLSDYSGERVYIGFNLTSDISVNKDGWYIDDVELTDASSNSTSVGLHKNESGAKAQAGNQISPFNMGLGVIHADDQATALKPEVNPDKIQPAMPKEKEPVKGEEISPAALPLDAQVSVIESGRSVNTNPENGSYSLMHAAGEFTVQAEAYGFHSDEQPVNIEKDSTTEANFTLEEENQYTVSGTVTDEASGEAIEGATVMLIEDANVTPVETDGAGNYALTAYEGMYTLKILARDYHGQEMEVDLSDGDVELNVELEPFYTYPGGEIGYDDGSAENARAFYDAGNGWAVKMSLPEGKDNAIVTDGVFKFWNEEFPVPGGTEFAVEVWDASGKDGLPGKKIAGPIEGEAVRDETDWTAIDLSEHAITVDSDFYMVYIQTDANTGAPGLATDESSPNAERSYQYVGGSWEQSPADEGNYMIRARVSYEVDAPVITSPDDGLLTNESEVNVEGTASPTTTIQLMNNDEAVETTEVGDDGKFTFPTVLKEGENEFTAVSTMDGNPVGESDPVTVTLDTEAPDLTIDNPKEGDKLNRETVTVEGTVADDHLDFVEVNGQKAKVEDGSYSKRILLDNGKNDIEVVAQDEAGNSTSVGVNVQVKYDAPEIENLTPTEDVTVAVGESVKVEFDSEPGLKTTFFIQMPLTNAKASTANATELPMMETSEGHYVGYWTATKKAYAEGAVLEVKAVDDFKNETRKQAEGKLFINVD